MLDIEVVEKTFGLEFPAGWRIIKIDDSRAFDGGVQLVLGFPNGYALSIIRNPYSYGHDEGLWEVGFSAYDVDTLKWDLISFEHAEHILGEGDQVSGWNTDQDVANWCERMASLPPHKGLPRVTRPR